MRRLYRGYGGYGDVNLSQEEWAHIFGQSANIVTTWIDYAGGYQFPLDGKFDMARANALISIIWNNLPSDAETDLVAEEALSLGLAPEEYALFKKLGLHDDDQIAAFKTVTGVTLPSMAQIASAGGPEAALEALAAKVPFLADEETFEAHAAGLTPPPGRTSGFKPPKVKGAMPWYGYAGMIGGGVVLGGLAVYFIKR